ncbi:MAG: Hsp20/alpha crystallin family protein [Peptococcaceae bacterium]|nr:Hsp20/alpha crystallin family protein [Peptococcaceae bacterium]
MLPRIFGEDLFDNFFNDDFMMRPMRSTAPQMMKTDVRELDGAYELDMDLPGFKKEDIKVDLKDGTLTISAARNAETNEKDDNGKLIRQERYSGSCKRSFYVGDIKATDISAKYEDGILKLVVPKFDKQAVPSGSTIAIE